MENYMATNEINGIVYMVTNKINGMQYIGQTVGSLDSRRYKHEYDALSNKDNNYFHSALSKYGFSNFRWEVLHTCSNIEELNKLEEFYIGYYDTFKGRGYNLRSGGSNSLFSDESKQRMSEVKKGMYDGENNPNYGKTTPDKTKLLISKANKDRFVGEKSPNFGKSPSKETRDKISKNRKGKCVGEDNHNFGKPMPDEIKQKISESKKGTCVGEENHFYGKTHTDEAKRKVSEKNTGKKRSIEVRQKMSEERMGEKNHFYGKTHTDEAKRIISEKAKERCKDKTKCSMYGKTFSDEHRKNMSESRIGKRMGKDNSNARAIIINGNYFYTVREAAEFLNIHKCTIWRRIKRQVPGYRYADID